MVDYVGPVTRISDKIRRKKSTENAESKKSIKTFALELKERHETRFRALRSRQSAELEEHFFVTFKFKKKKSFFL